MAALEATPLVEALRAGDPRQVGALIERGANIRYTRDHGYTALLDAVHGRDISRDPNLPDLIDLLVASGPIRMPSAAMASRRCASSRTPADSTRCSVCSMPAQMWSSFAGPR